MVDDYRLTRESQVQLAEGRFRQDEDYQLVTFKDWLQAFEWETEPDPSRPDSCKDAVAQAHDAVQRATRHSSADDPAPDRGQQLTRWHTDDRDLIDDAASAAMGGVLSHAR